MKEDLIKLIESLTKIKSDNLFLDQYGNHSENIELPTHYNYIIDEELDGVKYYIEIIHPINKD